MNMYVAGKWIDAGEVIKVRNPYNQDVIDTVPSAGLSELEAALASAERGARIMAELPALRRAEILKKAASKLRERSEEFARLLSLEVGKPIVESRVEVNRGAIVLELSGEEAGRLHGETVPLDAAPGGEGKLGFTLRVPCGVVAAITPFNFPLQLLCHKIGPALAGGNAVIAKPASDTPLSALKLTELLLECGLPPEAIQAITGRGGTLGEGLVSDRRVRKVSFTGSRDVAERLTRVAGIKKLSLELGGNSPVAVMDDADLDLAARVLAANGYANAGQVCISTQRILVQKSVYDEFLVRFQAKVDGLVLGNPLDETTQVGPMIRESDARRVERWIQEAASGGAVLHVGGSRLGCLVEPAILGGVDPSMKISCEELFGPAVALTPVEDLDQAITLTNHTPYGLAAGLFTSDLGQALKFTRSVNSGNIHINWGTQWRVDLMPYGGLKESGIGKEGPRYAVEEMTELKMVVWH